MNLVNGMEYVRGAMPDRWHWMPNCESYPRVVMMRRSVRLSSDLCDCCLDLERLAQKRAAAAVT